MAATNCLKVSTGLPVFSVFAVFAGPDMCLFSRNGTEVARADGVGDLRSRDVHHGFALEAGVAHVGYDADDLARLVLGGAAHAFADGDEVADRIGVHLLPVLPEHGAIDEDDARGVAIVTFGKGAAAEQADAQGVEL